MPEAELYFSSSYLLDFRPVTGLAGYRIQYSVLLELKTFLLLFSK